MQWRGSTLLIFVSFSPTYARWKARGNPVQFFFLSQIFGRSKNFFSKSNTKNCHLSNQFWSRNFVSKSNHLFDIAVSNQKISNETPCRTTLQAHVVMMDLSKLCGKPTNSWAWEWFVWRNYYCFVFIWKLLFAMKNEENFCLNCFGNKLV